MNWNRILSSFVAIIYIVGAASIGGAEAAFQIGIFLIFPLACIWFSKAMGNYTGLGLMWFDNPITQSSPGVLVCILGWVLLFLPVITGVIIYFST